MKIKTYGQFLREMVETDDDIQVQNNLDNDVQVQDEVDFNNEIENGVEDEVEDEEDNDMIEMTYDLTTGEWEVDGEFEEPQSYERFRDWFLKELDEEHTTASMTEEGDKVIFNIPEDAYVEYFEEVENAQPVSVNMVNQIDNTDEFGEEYEEE